jgi:protein PhnA
MADLSTLIAPLSARSGDSCELCSGTDGLQAHAVPPAPEPTAECCILVCQLCADQLAPEATLDPHHWYCLQESAWSQEPPVQVQAWRLLKQLANESWAQDLGDQLYLDEPTLAWAEATDGSTDTAPPTVDSNGTPLQDGDTVTLIRDLSVKGAGFTAKRGTTVKHIRLSDDPELIEGRVNKTAIFLKTCFLKKA